MIAFDFTGVPPSLRYWWLVISDSGVDVCDDDPGHPVRLTVQTSLCTLTLIWRGDLTWSAALRSGDLELLGEPQACRALPRWLTLSRMAGTPRPAGGAPRLLAVTG